MKFHPVYQYNCGGVCLVGQFYHFGGFKHRQWYELHRDSISYPWPSDVDAQICKSFFDQVGDKVDRIPYARMYSSELMWTYTATRSKP
jgi:hypothetical protein